MADVNPFRGVHFNPGIVEDLGLALCPPFDDITPRKQDELYSQSPYNLVRLEFPSPTESYSPNNQYEEARNQLDHWIREGILLRDESPGFYLVKESYIQDSSLFHRLILFCCVRLHDYASQEILPHELTRGGPKVDRLNMMQACDANFSPIMGLYKNNEGLDQLLNMVTLQPPGYIAQNDETMSRRMWTISDSETVDAISSNFRDQPIYLADGHHRYETALAYRDLQAEKPDTTDHYEAYNYVMMGLTDLSDPGVQLLSFHRIVSGGTKQFIEALKLRANDAFQLECHSLAEISTSVLTDQLSKIEASRTEVPTLGLIDIENKSISTLKLRKDVQRAWIAAGYAPEILQCEAWLLHNLILDPLKETVDSDGFNIEFAHDLSQIVSHSDDSVPYTTNAIFLVPALDLPVFEKLVLLGERLPPKTTYFYPKLPTGLVINLLDGHL